VMIGDDVTVVVLGIKGRQVRVGISAPKNINIYREEILSRLEPNADRAALSGRAPGSAPAIASPWPGVQTAAPGKRRLAK
jgi:carbon storage regulator